MLESIKISGEVENIIYKNSENGYTVIDINVADGLVTAAGVMPNVFAGEQLVLTGVYKNHPNYGEQFVVSGVERKTPTEAASILKYLSSGVIKGIGAVTAAALVKEFGAETLDIMRNSPERVSKLKGISKDKAKSFAKQLEDIQGLDELNDYLVKYKLSSSDCIKIWRSLGTKAIASIQSNPYVLCIPEIGISFEIADRIASENEDFRMSEYRIRAALTYVLTANKNNGHTCLPKDKLAQITAQYIELDLQTVLDVLAIMAEDNSLKTDELDGREFMFLPELFDAETYAAARIQMMLRYPAARITNIDEEIADIEDTCDIKYADLQREAIEQALSKGLLILTGGPGTGKTTTLNAIIKILKKNGEKVLLAAPTGRAAHRMSELTGCEAKTIHRLLEVYWADENTPKFKRNERNQLSCDALVLDELSMVDSQLFESVVRALPMGCRLIMVGDSDQLPSVGPGNVLGDLTASGEVPVVALKEIFRQSMSSLIVTNAHKIVNGEMPRLDIRNSDFFFLESASTDVISSTIVDLFKNRLPKSYGYSSFDDIQILSPGKKGDLGTIELNKKLQLAVNPPQKNKKEINIGGKIFREGDKVMVMRNNYDISWTKDDGETGEGIFNGDVGILVEINKSLGNLKVRFDNKTAVFTWDDIPDLDLAYAVTVHKSQGNEFEAVIIPMYKSTPKLYYRNLLYTAVTRAKKLLILVGLPSTVRYMVDNNRRTLRYTALKYFLTR